jgi:hypothetical protein
VAAEPTPHAFSLQPGQTRELSAGAQPEGAALARRIKWRMTIALPLINVLEAAVTYVFVMYVVPLPGPGLSAPTRRIELICTIALVTVCWFACDYWGGRTLGPVQQWLRQDRDPTPEERLRTLRLPLLQAGQVLVV